MFFFTGLAWLTVKQHVSPCPYTPYYFSYRQLPKFCPGTPQGLIICKHIVTTIIKIAQVFSILLFSKARSFLEKMPISLNPSVSIHQHLSWPRTAVAESKKWILRNNFQWQFPLKLAFVRLCGVCYVASGMTLQHSCQFGGKKDSAVLQCLKCCQECTEMI